MASFNKINNAVNLWATTGLSFSSGTWKAALTSSSNPPSATTSSYGGLTSLATSNGYTAGGAAITMTTSNTAGTETVGWSAASPTWTGTSANSSAGFTFQYVLFYDSASSNNFCWFDNGASLTISPGDTLTLSSTAAGVLFTLT